jgi:hypothetical protein
VSKVQTLKSSSHMENASPIHIILRKTKCVDVTKTSSVEDDRLETDGLSRHCNYGHKITKYCTHFSQLSSSVLLMGAFFFEKRIVWHQPFTVRYFIY